MRKPHLKYQKRLSRTQFVTIFYDFHFSIMKLKSFYYLDSNISPYWFISNREIRYRVYKCKHLYCKVSIKVSSDLSNNFEKTLFIFSTGRSGYLDYLKIMTSVKAGHLATGIGCNSGQSSLLG